MARLNGHPVEAAHIVTAEGSEWLVPRCEPTWTPEWREHVDRQGVWQSASGEQLARQALTQRLRILEDGKRFAMPLFRKTSMAVAEKLFGNVPDKKKSIADADESVAKQEATVEDKRIRASKITPGTKRRERADGVLQRAEATLVEKFQARNELEEAVLTARRDWQTGGAHKAATGAAAKSWYTTYKFPGEEEDRWVQRALPSYDPVATIRDDPELLSTVSSASSLFSNEEQAAYTFVSAMKLVWEDLAESILTDAKQKWCSDMTRWRKS